MNNYFFPKYEFNFNLEIIIISINDYNIVMWVMKLFRVLIMMIFNMSTSYIHKISFPYFEDYLMTKLTSG
jgi:hypothetical protein